METLLSVHVGARVFIRRITDPQTALMAVRLGIAEGETLSVHRKVPGGPVIVCRGKVEIALGRDICQYIEVECDENKAGGGK